MGIKRGPKVNAKHDLTNLTLGAKHVEITAYYASEHGTQLPELQKKLEASKSKLNKLKKKNVFSLTEKERLDIYHLESQIEELTKQIDNINNHAEETEYYLNTMEHLYDYYYPEGGHENRAEIFEQYLKKLDPTYAPKVKKQDDIYWCLTCQTERRLNINEGTIVCINCGLTDYTIIEDNKQSYSDGMMPQESNYFSYKKVTHFKECLEQCQGKERTDIPREVFKKIIDKLEEEGIYDRSKLTHPKMREILRELRLSRFYEHTPFILAKLGGQDAPVIPPHIEDRLEQMFKEIQIAFKKCCPESRVNFPSYNYVLHKCVELIGTCDELLEHFPLLKSKQKLQNMDIIWHNICKILGYEFISSI